ncbi:MFS transporter [Spiractinospora alimapuensis]|uniref:MFS transporter n=1 Tax=Spiractinospora alimapuensis TaxID=2820884 RepID=UPI001F2AB66C|nr:MFS transporter [Spiractinospora alimapuensis]QVQ53762.1 MFS transporter [Spiractinospora alimapuensis]
MMGRYARLFARRGTVPMTTAGVLARMPLSMVGVGVITMIATTHGSYALAGTVAGVYALVTALVTPQVARLVDRYGQRRVVLPVAVVSSLGLLALLTSSALGGHESLLLAFAALAGVTPSAPALVRSRWSYLLKESDDVHTAYSWETVVDEVCFIVGPPVSIGLSVMLFPQAGPILAGLLLLLGALWLVTQRGTEPPVAVSKSESLLTRRATGVLSTLTDRTVRTVVVVMVALGVIIGTVDVVSVAFAEHQGNVALASVVLSVYAVGSCLSGFVFGSRTLTRPIGGLLRVGMSATALATIPLLIVGDIAVLSATVFVAGLFFAPTMIMAAQLIEKNVPSRSLTEALTWSTAGLGLGVALGPAIAGPLVDLHGASFGFWVAVGAGAVLLTMALTTGASLRERPPGETPMRMPSTSR